MSLVIKFYSTSSMLNIFRTWIHPSSGACDFSVVSPHLSCVLVSMCTGISVWLGQGGNRVAGAEVLLLKPCQQTPVNHPWWGSRSHQGSQGQQGSGSERYTEQGIEAPSQASTCWNGWNKFVKKKKVMSWNTKYAKQRLRISNFCSKLNGRIYIVDDKTVCTCCCV